jgi:hypothetical protein
VGIGDLEIQWRTKFIRYWHEHILRHEKEPITLPEVNKMLPRYIHNNFLTQALTESTNWLTEDTYINNLYYTGSILYHATVCHRAENTAASE